MLQRNYERRANELEQICIDIRLEREGPQNGNILVWNCKGLRGDGCSPSTANGVLVSLVHRQVHRDDMLFMRNDDTPDRHGNELQFSIRPNGLDFRPPAPSQAILNS